MWLARKTIRLRGFCSRSLGVIGIHQFYMGKWGTAIIYLVTLGIFGIGLIYDFWTLNSQISELNLSQQQVR